jgi:multidrug efflux pump
MNISRFFISRPIFAAMLSALILLAGLISLPGLPISEYPEVVPPTVVVRANYPGASPGVIADTVASPLEQSINGVEDMLYQYSQATSDGVMTLTVTFKLGTDIDKAQEQVQNRVAQALPKLPQDVQRLGVVTNKSSPDITLAVFVYSPNGRYDQTYLSNFVALRIKDELARLDGVGDVQRFGGGDYSMRVWLDPERVAARGLTTDDVVRAIREQNVQVAAGQLGAPPSANGASFQLSVNTRGRLRDETDFENIIVKTGAAGQLVRLRDVARVELGSDNYALRAMLDNRVAVAIPIFQRPGSNAIAVSDEVRAKMAELKKSFPEGIDYNVAYDPTVFVRGSIHAVLHTLLEAIVLVVIVVIVFLQTWRASVIPLIAVPVSLIGTFAVMHVLGFGLNALSLFGLVLAIGIVVDDAIVVVENVERNIHEGLAPLDATRQAMKEVTGPIIATALVLCAVFVPTAFISGLSGQFYKQFALTIASSTVISAFNSLTLSPALSAVLLRPRGAPPDRVTVLLNRSLGWFFRPFNRFFGRASGGYVGTVGRLLRSSSIALFVYGGLIALTWLGFAHTPTGFVPQQDKQYLVAYAQLPCRHSPACRSTGSPTPPMRASRSRRSSPSRSGAIRRSPPARSRRRCPPSTRRSWTHTSRCSRRRRCRVSAPSAASSSRSRTAAISGRTSCIARRRTCSPRRGSGRSSRGCSPASRSTFRRSRWTSTARSSRRRASTCRTCTTPCRCTSAACT